MEFLKIVISFYICFCEVISFWFSNMVSFFRISSDLDCSVVISFKSFYLRNVVCFNFNNSYWDRNVVFSKYVGYVYFMID